MPAGRTFAAESKGPDGDLEVVDENQQVACGIERRIRAQRRQRGAAAVHVGRGFQDADGDAGHAALGRARPLGAAERRQAPVRRDRVGQPEAGVVARRRVFRTGISEADDRAQG